MLTELTKKVLFIRCMLVFTVSLHTCGSNRVKRGFCSTRNLDIKNGDYRLRSGNSVAEFTCDDGFQLYGVERIVCFTSKWSNDPPMCISNTCAKIPPTSTLKVVEEFEGAVLKFSCAVMHQLDGQKQLICDGTDWNGPAPSCKPWNPPQTCDFEDPEICGWSHHDKDDQDWRWNTGKTSTSRTGPSHDHTLGDVGNGHYMYFETSSPTRTDHRAVLQSPLYPPEYSQQKCFIFWYHIYGEGDISDLEVFVKPESIEDLNKLQRIFHVNDNGGDVWYEESVKIPVQSEPFQVLFVATRGTTYRSDIAIDDAALGECAGTLPPVYITTAPRNVTDLTEPATTVVQPTTKRTTVQSTVPLTTTTPKQTPKPTQKTTVKRPDTTQPTQTTKTTQKTPKPSTTQKTSTKEEITTVKQTSTAETTVTSSTTTLQPEINPNLPSRKKRIPGEARDGPSVVWIVLGVAMVLVAAVAILFVIYLYRRRQNRRRKQEPLSSSNPLYIAVNGDEAVHFAADTDDLGDF